MIKSSRAGYKGAAGSAPLVKSAAAQSTIRRAAVALLCVALAACGGAKKALPPAATTSPATAATGPVALLTGLPLADSARRERPLLVVKVDNHPLARPQFGLDRADDVVEEKVEGGISRFMALFQSNDVDTVGPVRSLRSTDPAWLTSEGGMIAYSGGIDAVKALLPKAGIVDIGADNHGPTYYKRRGDRSFEHGMYTDTNVLRTLTPKGLPAPKALFQYLPQGQVFGGAGAVPVTSVNGRMAELPTATTFDWTWDQGSGLFRRGSDGAPHLIENAGQIGMRNVVIQFTRYQPTQWRDRSNTPVDEAVVTGNGEAWILSNGLILKGRWSRASTDAVTTYTDSAGIPVKIQPGQSWIMLLPEGQQVAVR